MMPWLPVVKEVWQGRVFADSPDEAALKIREARGCANGKLVVKEIWPGPDGWYEYRVEYGRINE